MSGGWTEGRDEETGQPIKRATVRLKGRTESEIFADIKALFENTRND